MARWQRLHTSVSEHERGFTLVEVLVALMVLGVGIFGTSRVFLSSLATTSYAEARTRASGLATRETEAMRAIPYASLGFAAGSTGTTYESLSTVFVAAPQTAPTGTPVVMDGVSFAITRAIVWVADGPNPQAFKRTTTIISWTD